MTDPRPSENTDEIPQWPGFRAAGFFDDLPTSIFDNVPEFAPAVESPIEDLIEKAENAHDPGHGAVFAQLATVHAIREQTTQLARIADAIAEIDITVDLGGAS